MQGEEPHINGFRVSDKRDRLHGTMHQHLCPAAYKANSETVERTQAAQLGNARPESLIPVLCKLC